MSKNAVIGLLCVVSICLAYMNYRQRQFIVAQFSATEKSSNHMVKLSGALSECRSVVDTCVSMHLRPDPPRTFREALEKVYGK